MSSFISFAALCVFALLASLAVLIRRRRVQAALWLATALLAIVILLFRPACRPVDEATLARFDPPIESREERNFYGLRVFQQKDGGWYHCKTWIARKLFF